MPAKRSTGEAQREADEARREAEKSAKIQTRGLPVPDLPKNVIANELRSRIQRGVYRPGEQVPSIGDVMAMTEPAVAKNTARAALDQLRDAGFVKTLTGYGSFVRPEKDWGTTPEQRGEA
jgi:DNA-binding FadR family transcriptional regulator